MSERISRKDFLVKGAQAAFVVSGLTACGKLLSGEAFAASKAAGITVGEDGFLLSVEDLQKQGAVSFQNNGKKAILLYNDGEIRAFQNVCTHRGGWTKLVGKKLVCQWHGAVFDPLTGKAIKPPAPKGSQLKAISVGIKDGKIFLVK